MTGVVSVFPGAQVALEDGEVFTVIKIRSAEFVLIESRQTFRRKSVPIASLRPVPVSTDDTFDVVEDAMTDYQWEDAQLKLDAVQQVAQLGGGQAAVNEIAAKVEVHPATLYRWIKSYSKSQRVADLNRKRRSDAGVRRLSLRLEALIRKAIKDHYLSDERLTIKDTHKELERLCKRRKLRTPSIDTMKTRLALCPTLEAAEARGDTKLANKLRLNVHGIRGADFPYALVQIDHTLVDIQLVDEDLRVPIGRPWITVAIDVYSRVCVGYYISFDPPGTLGTGLCLTHAILDKKKWMARLGVDYDYPCQGIPGIVHVDNAKEFRGNSFRVACDLHHMDLQFRKVRKPRYGAHIERMMGTLMAEIHTLPGTTFSNPQEKQEYDSEGRAVFTLAAFERWLAHLILGEYHNRPHAGLNGLPPLVKFKRGLTGEDGLPTGTLRIETDEERLYLDFLPGEMLTVQQYGAQWDVIQYSADVLRRWVGSRDPQAPTRARRFMFKRDPRDISALFFKDPETDRYFRIPYRNLANPHISVWELRRVRKYLRDQNRKVVDEETIMSARDEMRAVRLSEEEKTASKRGGRRRYTARVRDAKRRQESPQPQFGRPALGRPEVLASEVAAPVETSVGETADDAASLPQAQVPIDDPAGVVPATSRRAVVRRDQDAAKPATPFDEIEDY